MALSNNRRSCVPDGYTTFSKAGKVGTQRTIDWSANRTISSQARPSVPIA